MNRPPRPGWPAGLLFGFCAAVVTGLCGAAGAGSGLVIGLRVYRPTAWAAMFEISIPATVVGSGVGAVAGCLALGVRHVVRRAGR